MNQVPVLIFKKVFLNRKCFSLFCIWTLFFSDNLQKTMQLQMLKPAWNNDNYMCVSLDRVPKEQCKIIKLKMWQDTCMIYLPISSKMRTERGFGFSNGLNFCCHLIPPLLMQPWKSCFAFLNLAGEERQHNLTLSSLNVGHHIWSWTRGVKCICIYFSVRQLLKIMRR